jgi:hypothetical protein
LPRPPRVARATWPLDEERSRAISEMRPGRGCTPGPVDAGPAVPGDQPVRRTGLIRRPCAARARLGAPGSTAPLRVFVPERPRRAALLDGAGSSASAGRTGRPRTVSRRTVSLGSVSSRAGSPAAVDSNGSRMSASCRVMTRPAAATAAEPGRTRGRPDDGDGAARTTGPGRGAARGGRLYRRMGGTVRGPVRGAPQVFRLPALASDP